MKKCFKCGELKPLDEFYCHPQMADGHLGKCKTCTKRDTREREEQLRLDPAWVTKERARQREKFHRLHHTWNHDEKAGRAAKKRWDKRNRHKRQAQWLLSNAVRDGRATKPSACKRCGVEPTPRNLHGHHHDYGKPLDVEWICSGCHGKEHRAA
ncbi:hypothetical protein LCGC14_2765360 [marine sediment metagenome]|uniref:Uncharacterized protein n=1 Tax=marine sediment metagenome TaxID=412755 RepID=A0A0F8YXQ0_9ZZZZ